MLALQQSSFSAQPVQDRSRGTLLKLLPPLEISCSVHHAGSDNKRQTLENFIAERFFKVHRAIITEFMPRLVGLHCHDRLSATAGVRTGAEGRLFTENYLDKPVEQVLSESLDTSVARTNIVEFGNLAASWRGPSQLLFLLLAAALHRAGFQWAVFAATGQVQQLIRRLGFNTRVLCEADPLRLGDKCKQWGSYYQNNPVVIAGGFEHAIQTAHSTPHLNLLLEEQESLVATISAEFNNRPWQNNG